MKKMQNEECLMPESEDEDTILLNSSSGDLAEPRSIYSFNMSDAADIEVLSVNSDSGSGSNEVPIYLSSVHSNKNGKCESSRSNFYVWLLATFAGIGGFLFGYDTGVISGAMLLLREEFSLSSFEQELVVSVTIGAAFFAALVGGFLNDKFGRKVVTLLGSVIFMVGAIVLGVSDSVEVLVAGRFILGVGIGLASMTVPVYIAESAPVYMRGRLVTMNGLFITGGQCVASLMGGGFSYIKPDGWRYMLGVAAIPALIQFCGFLFLPESPRWLMKKGQELKAQSVLMKLRGTHQVDSEMQEIQHSLQVDAENVNKDSFTVVRILKTPTVRRAFVIGCSLQLVQQLCGINTVMYYSATIIRMSGVNNTHTAIWLASITAGVNFLFTLVGVWMVESIGRRKLVLGSLAGVTLSLAVLALAFQLAAFNSPAISGWPGNHKNSSCSSYRWCESCIENTNCGFCYMDGDAGVNGTCLSADSHQYPVPYGSCEHPIEGHSLTWAYDFCPTSYSWIAIVGLVMFLMCFAPGMGPMPWMINAEIYPLWARSTSNSLTAATNWITNLFVSMTFLTLTESLTKYGTYWLYVVFSLAGLVFFSAFLPETKGRELENMEELFAQPLCIRCSRKTSRYISLTSQVSS